MKYIKPILGYSFLLFMALSLHSKVHAATALTSFTTGGHTVYHLQPATVMGKQRAIVCATFDGTVMCYTPTGTLLWSKKVNNYFPYDLAVADVNGDGLDETFVATANGTVDAYGADGTPLWSFTTTSGLPLYKVCPTKTASGSAVILTGGVEKILYSISATGTQLKTYKTLYAIREIKKGNIFGDGKDCAAIALQSYSLQGKLFIGYIDPETLTPRLAPKQLQVEAQDRIMSMVVYDMNKDGKEDVIMSGDPAANGLIFAYDYTGTQIYYLPANTLFPSHSYRMILLNYVKPANSTNDGFLFGLFGNDIFIYNHSGSYSSVLKCKYDFTNACYDPQSNTYYLGSSMSGGDGVYAFNLNVSTWKTEFQAFTPIGVLKSVVDNMATLNTQIAKFVKPAYQKAPAQVTIVNKNPPAAKYSNIIKGTMYRWTESCVAGTSLWNNVTDSRYYPYTNTAAEIVAFAKQKETAGEDFVLWVWHGEALYMAPSTLEEILKVAPKHFQGFIAAELEQTTANMKNVVTQILPTLADQCLAANKKIYFRNKNIFWNGVCYLDFWRNVLFNPKYKSVFVMSMEETSDRMQEMSLAATVGLWKSNTFDSWSCRVVTDNANFFRFHEWDAQQVLSHHLRQMVLRASLGADSYLVDINMPEYNAVAPQLFPFYDMVAKGVVAIPKKEELLSVSELCLGIKSPPNSNYITHGVNSHQFDYVAASSSTPMVFDKLDGYWGGSTIPDYDFSNYGHGSERRLLNFLPKYPYGLVAIVPDTINTISSNTFKDKVSTDGQSFYDESGVKTAPAAYKSVMLDKLAAAAAKLPVLVKGDASWSVVRLDSSHVRITLVDPGYTDPADRDVEVVLQQFYGAKCTDILSGENLDIINNKIQVHIPTGIFRIIDVEYTNFLQASSLILNKLTTSIKVGQSELLTATVTPLKSTVFWNSSDTTIAKVDNNGKITGLKVGTAEITASGLNGSLSTSCMATISEAYDDSFPFKVFNVSREINLILDGKSEVDIFLYSMQGNRDKSIKSSAIVNKFNVPYEGIYLLHVIENGKSYTKKICIK